MVITAIVTVTVILTSCAPHYQHCDAYGSVTTKSKPVWMDF